ncbi:MAG TPA: RDD family protein [Planctomycetaceae bacterium]|jgi:uncharacterized RDD family membrane protein YckC|nr:RDD family protein [Planctomycetaceae bacterium]
METAIDASEDPSGRELPSAPSRGGSSAAGDIYSIGWWIESADDEIYGPVSRATLGRFLNQRVLSPNTLVRHCTEPTKRPVIDVPGVREGLPAGASLLAHGDKLGEAWPRRKRERLALAQDSLPCVWKNRPAVLVCVRCGAPYCEKLRAKPFKRQFYFCQRCQSRLYNRRALACILDFFLLYLLFVIVPLSVVGALHVAGALVVTEATIGGIYYGLLVAYTLAFAVRDRVMTNAGPGKRVLGLRVVQTTDGHTPLTYGQAFLRWLALYVPVFGLIDLSAPYRDPLMRRYGDRWAGTRVIDTEGRLSRLRQRVQWRLFKKKGVRLANPVVIPMSAFAQIAE